MIPRMLKIFQQNEQLIIVNTAFTKKKAQNTNSTACLFINRSLAPFCVQTETALRLSQISNEMSNHNHVNAV